MSEGRQCFCCAWEIGKGDVIHGEARTGVPDWKSVVLCGVCANKIRSQDEALIYRGDEWVNVRVRNGKRDGGNGQDPGPEDFVQELTRGSE